MKRLFPLIAVCALSQVAAWGDTAFLGSAVSFAAIPKNLAASLGTGNPYWDNLSGDGNQKDVGYFLTGTGGFAGSMDYAPIGYLSQNNGAGLPDAPTDIAFQRSSSTLALTFLANITADHSETFGYFNNAATTTAAAAASEVPILGPGSLTADAGLTIPLSITAGSTYGFYLTKCVTYTAGPSSPCVQTTTWFSNAALDTSDPGHQHFAVFDTANPSVFYVGIEDSFNGSSFEGYGDFQDFVFELSTGGAPPPSVPESGTFVLIGAGLIGFGFAGRLTNKHFRADRKPASTPSSWTTAPTHSGNQPL